MQPDLRTALGDGVETLGLSLSGGQIDQMLTFVDLLMKWNAVYNLTAVRNRQELISHHVLDCLAALQPLLQKAPVDRFLDIGAGGGFPGIVWAIALDGNTYPRAEATLIDSVDKKVAFQRQVRGELGLSNLSPVHGRVEKWQSTSYSLITSRAFSTLADLTRDSEHLLSNGGQWAALKAHVAPSERADLPKVFTIIETIPITLPGLPEITRNLVLIRRRAESCQTV